MNETQFYRPTVTNLPPTVTHKWSVEVLTEGFIPFPKRLLRCLGDVFTGPSALEDLRILLAVIDFRRPSSARSPSIEYLAFIAGMTVQAANDAVIRLEGNGLVASHAADGGIAIDISPLLAKVISLTKEGATQT